MNLHRFTLQTITAYSFDYYQGYIDTALYFEYLDPPDRLLASFSYKYLRHYLIESERLDFSKTLDLLTRLMSKVDSHINQSLLTACNTQPYYAIPWILTLFCHNNKDMRSQYCLLDYLIVSHPNSIYFFCVVLIFREFGQIKRLGFEDDPEYILRAFQRCQFDGSELPGLLSKTEELKRRFTGAFNGIVAQVVSKER